MSDKVICVKFFHTVDTASALLLLLAFYSILIAGDNNTGYLTFAICLVLILQFISDKKII